MPDKYKLIFQERKSLMDKVNPDGDFDRYFSNDFYLDTWYDNPFYGKVDTKGYAVIPKEQKLKFATFSTDPRQVQAIDFVSDLFKNVKREYELNYKKGNLNKKSQFFRENLSALSGFSTSRPLYLEKLKDLYSKFLDEIISNNLLDKINDYDLFLTELKLFLARKNLYFTRAGFVESIEFSPLYTGLVIDVYNGSGSNLKLKESFYKDINYPAFLELCLKNGFVINKEIPWRLVCDIRKKIVAEKISELNETSQIQFGLDDFKLNLQKLFDVYYTSVLPIEEKDYDYFREFIVALEGFYNSFILQFPTFKIIDIDKCNRPKISSKNKNVLKSFKNTNEMNKFYIKLFFEMRKIEIKDNINNNTIEGLENYSLNIYDQFSEKNVKKAVCESIRFFNENVSTLPYRERSINQGGPIRGPA